MASTRKGLVIGPRVPRGLAPAVEGLAREILRHRPQDIYTFAAHHFEQLIELRETERASVNVSNIFDRASSNRKRRVLVDWIGLDNKFQPVSDGGSNHDRYNLSDRRGHDSVGTLTTTSAKKLARRRRKAGGAEAAAATAANRNGWSINETVKVFKKHADEYNEYANKEKSRKTQKSKKSIGKEIRSYQVQRSPRLSKTIVHCRFHRSWSVEDMHLAKNSSRRFKENQVEPKCNCGSIELGVTRKLENDASTCNKSSDSVENIADTPVRCLNRQKSVGQTEDVRSSSSRVDRDRVEYYIAVPRRTCSLANITSNRSYGRGSSGKEVTEDISNEIVQSRQGRGESVRGKGIEGTERKKSEAEERECRVTVTDMGVEKLNARLESDGTGSKDNGRAGDTFDYEFPCDSKGIDIDDDANVIIDEPKFLVQEDTSDLTTKQKDFLDNQESVILPSVIRKQCSNSRYTENVAERSENDTNYLTLPPISADALKPIKSEDNLVLPVLSKLSEVIEIDRQPLKSSGDDRIASIEDGREHTDFDVSVSESRTLQSSDCDYRGASPKTVHRTARSCDEETTDANRYETAQSACKTTVVERATENDEGSEVNVEMYALEENGSNVTPDFTERPQTLVKSLDRTNVIILRKDEERENEKENEQKNKVSSSLAGENGASTTTIGDEQKRREERRKMKKQKIYPVGNDELKSKLIEIETVERNIESTLISSGTVSIAEDDRESVCSRPIDCMSNLKSESDTESEKSSILFGNNLEATCSDGEMLQEKHARDTKEDSLCNGSSKSDETDMVPREASNASTVVSSSVEDDDVTVRVDVGDGEQSEQARARARARARHQVAIDFAKDVDLSCYVLTEGSPCEIPESVTTVIIPDKRETIDDASRTKDTVEQDTNPFGEYIVYPAETFQYSTNDCHVDFLCDVKDAADRSLAYKDLGNIKEEGEEEEEVEGKYDEKVSKTRRTADAPSAQLEQNDSAEVANVPTKTTVFANQERGEATLEDRTCEQQFFLDHATEPCVPELNLDSFRDATLSSVEDESESINVENLSEKASVGGNVLSEAETISASFDTVSAKRNAIIDENSLSDSRPKPDRFHGENATRGHDCSIDRRDSSNMEEAIARELIKNLTGDASMLEEATDRNTATEATDSFDRNDNMPSEHTTVSTATVDPIDINTDKDLDMDIDVDVDVNVDVDVDVDVDLGIGIDGDTRDDESKVKGEGGSVAGTCSRSDIRCEQFSENQDQSEPSKEPVIESNLRNKSLDAAVRIIQFRVREFMRRRRNSKKSDEEENDQRDSLDTSTVQKATLSLPRQNVQQKKSQEAVAISNDRCCDEEKFRDSTASEESIPKKKNEEWLSTALAVAEAAENQRSFGKQCSTHGSIHTGEFHDSLPLPLPLPLPLSLPLSLPLPLPVSEISKGRVSSTNATARALERVRDDAVKPLLTLKPDTSSFRYESPETCVLLAFDFPKSLQLIENASNWSKICVNLPSCVTRIERDFNGDKAKVDSFAGECFSYDVDDIREPLALDKTPKTVLIEEILTDEEEEKERLPSQSDNAVDEHA